MKHLFLFHKDKLSRFFLWPKPDLSRLFLIEKRSVALWLFYLGVIFAYFTTLTPWPLWPFHRYYMPIASLPILLGLALSLRLQKPVFTRKDFLLPTLSMMLMLLTMAIGSGRNINGIFMVAFSSVVYFSIFKVNIPELRKLGDVIATIMAALMVVSIPMFILHLLGFPLPHTQASFGEYYTFDNYRFFLVDHRFNWELIPRFHSIFLEPGHLGMACLTLLYAQAGKWDTWRCRILFLALFMTFSVAAYLCMVVMLFSVSWMKGKAVIGKILFLGGFFLALGVGSMFYNRGDNLFNQMIVSRVLLNEDGEMEGNNRTTELFTKEYENTVASGDIIMGKGTEELDKFGFGNSGYRVFIYSYGLISVFSLFVLFYGLLHTSANRRTNISFLLIHALSFWAHGYPHRFYFFVPLYIFLFCDVFPPEGQIKVEPDYSGVSK